MFFDLSICLLINFMFNVLSLGKICYCFYRCIIYDFFIVFLFVKDIDWVGVVWVGLDGWIMSFFVNVMVFVKFGNMLFFGMMLKVVECFIVMWIFLDNFDKRRWILSFEYFL